MIPGMKQFKSDEKNIAVFQHSIIDEIVSDLCKSRICTLKLCKGLCAAK